MAPDFGLEKIKEVAKSQPWGAKLDWHRILLITFVFLSVIAMLSTDFFTGGMRGVELERPSPETIKAPRSIKFVDRERTEQLRREAAKSVKKVYHYDPTATSRVQKNIRQFFTAISQVKSKQGLDVAGKLRLIREKTGAAISSEVLQRYLALSPKKLAQSEVLIKDIVGQLMSERITEENIGPKRRELRLVISDLSLSRGDKQTLTEVGSFYLESNYLYDPAQTDHLRKEAVSRVKPVMVRKVKGEVIIAEGKIIKPVDIEALKALGLLRSRFDPRRIAGTVLLSLIILIAFGVYLHRYQPQVYSSNCLLLLMSVITLTVLLIARLLPPLSSPYLVPVAAVGMLVAILINPELAIVLVLLTSLLAGRLVTSGFEFVVVAVMSGLLAIYLVSHVSHRTDLARAGFWLMLATAFLCLATTLALGSSFKEVFLTSIWGLVGGFFSAVLTIGTLPFLEQAFGITTDIRLLELSDPNQPLLRDLMINAPGSYNHSVVTANLAEAAAEKVEANPILARVGSYYHDIGKAKRPYFFIENQVGGQNPHDETNPNLSCLIITAHVKEGIELAKEHKLPSEIIDIIAEHHGDSVVTYFFHEAKKKVAKEQICEADFRYGGRRPQSREAALVMLADSVEAAARSIAKPSPARLEQLIQKIIQNKLEDRQLDGSNLTLTDLEKVTKSFTQVLSSVYHTRVWYPGTGEIRPVESADGNPNN